MRDGGRRLPHSTRKPPGRDCLLPASSVRRPAQAGFVLIIFDAPIRRQGRHPQIGKRPRKGRARHPKTGPPNPTCCNHRRPNRPRAIANLADGRLSGSRLRRSLSGGGGNLPLRCSGKPQAFTSPADGPPSGSPSTSITFRSRQQRAALASRQTSGLSALSIFDGAWLAAAIAILPALATFPATGEARTHFGPSPVCPEDGFRAYGPHLSIVGG